MIIFKFFSKYFFLFVFLRTPVGNFNTHSSNINPVTTTRGQ